MGRKLVIVVLLVAVVLTLCTATALARPSHGKPMMWQGNFNSLNGSVVSGHVKIWQYGNTLDVFIEVTGLDRGKAHLMGIHGIDGATAVAPPLSADVNGDGIISYAEGLPFFGPELVALTPTKKPDHRASIVYRQWISGAPLDAKNVALSTRVILIQGAFTHPSYTLTYYDPTIPVAIASLHRIGPK